MPYSRTLQKKNAFNLLFFVVAALVIVVIVTTAIEWRPVELPHSLLNPGLSLHLFFFQCFFLSFFKLIELCLWTNRCS